MARRFKTSAVALGAVAVLMGVGIKTSSLFRTTRNPGDLPMRVAFPYDRAPGEYDPANITLAPEYVFLENTFSPLIEMDIHGNVVPGVASHFEWVGDEAVLTMRSDLKTADGQPITAEDAEASLKRLLILSGNSHGNIQDLLCRGKQPKSLGDQCAGIEVNGNKLILKPGAHKPFLFPMLTAIDFAVIPKASLDPVTLAIKDFRKTSGPYYVSRDGGGGHITLRANPYHYHHSNEMPQEIQLVPMDRSRANSSLAALEEGRVDLVTTIDAATPEEVLQYYQSHADKLTLHTTMNLRNIVLCFTEKGQRVLTREQRLSIGKKVREAFNAFGKTTLAFKPGSQFFPVYGEGGLSDQQLQELNKAFDTAPDIKIDGHGMKAPIVRLALRDQFARILQDALPGIEVVEGQSPAFIDYTNREEQMPELFIAGPDTGFLEDIGLVSYSMNAGYLNIPKDQRRQWLTKYGDMPHKIDRIAELNRRHFESLMGPIVVPLAVAPFVALATKDWDIGLSKLFGNNQLWMFKHK